MSLVLFPYIRHESLPADANNGSKLFIFGFRGIVGTFAESILLEPDENNGFREFVYVRIMSTNEGTAWNNYGWIFGGILAIGF